MKPKYNTQKLSLVASTNARFSDFAPYVPSLNDTGVVSFQAATSGGIMGIYTTSTAGHVTTVIDTTRESFAAFTSHPDINERGATCFYARLRDGREGVYLVASEYIHPIASTGMPIADTHFANIGPLGPTMNDQNMVAFRADLATGAAGVFVGDNHGVACIADTSQQFSAFHGLPVVNAAGEVLFRADRPDGTGGIYLHQPGCDAPITIAETGPRFASLARFPTCNDEGKIAFVAIDTNGASGVYLAAAHEAPTQVPIQGDFASIRGALLDASGHITFFATPPDGNLGVYTQDNPKPLLAIGHPYEGVNVTEFALNPVSINNTGHLTIRATLVDKHQIILSTAPAATHP